MSEPRRRPSRGLAFLAAILLIVGLGANSIARADQCSLRHLRQLDRRGLRATLIDRNDLVRDLSDRSAVVLLGVAYAALIITSGRCRLVAALHSRRPTTRSSVREWSSASSRFRAACRACSTIGSPASFPPRRFSTRWSGGGSGATTPRSTCRCSSSPVSIAFRWWRSMSSAALSRASAVRAGRRCRRMRAKGSPIRPPRAKAICASLPPLRP